MASSRRALPKGSVRQPARPAPQEPAGVVGRRGLTVEAVPERAQRNCLRAFINRVGHEWFPGVFRLRIFGSQGEPTCPRPFQVLAL
jgi:hypothetical protein